MFQHLLIAMDVSPHGERALRQGLGQGAIGNETVATVTESWTEAAYATLPARSLVQIYETAAAGNAALILDRVKKGRRPARGAAREPPHQGSACAARRHQGGER